MAQNGSMKLVCEVSELTFNTKDGVSNPTVTVIFGGERRKVKNRIGRVSSLKIQETFEFIIDESTESSELSVQVKESRGGLSIRNAFIGSTVIDNTGSLFNAMGKAREGSYTLVTKDEKVGEVKLKFKVEKGLPKGRVSSHPKQPQQQQPKRKEMRRPGNVPLVIALVREKDEIGLGEFLSNESPEEINAVVAKSGNSGLHEACMDRSQKILVMLLQNEHTDVNLKNIHYNTPLHYFCEKWNSPQFMDCFLLFLKRGANVNALNSNGESPIYKAITNSSIRLLLMEALIAHDADVNILSTAGEGLLHYAVRFQREDLLKVILQASPRLDSRGNKGKTAYEIAVEYNHTRIAEYLKQVDELFTWMDSVELSPYKSIFVKNEITMMLLQEITEASLGQMGIDSVGARMKIMKAIKEKGPNATQNSQTNGCHQTGPMGGGGILPGRKKDIEDKQLQDLQQELAKFRQGQSDWLIDINSLEYVKHLGAGASGDVYRGLYNGTQIVAIKVLKEMTADQEVDEFKKEFEILSTIHHSNVVFFYGAAFQPRLCMVIEYCSRGNLHSVMKDNSNVIGWDRCIAICKETCAGLSALHASQILHRDLKSPNLLVTEQWHIKLCDFGLSRFNTADNIDTMKQMRGTFAYCDPEVYNGGIFTAASDIYSLSVIIWEIVNRVIKKKYDQPYSEYKHLTFDFQIIIQAAKEELRPTIPATCPLIFKDLITRTWNKAQNARPSLDQIVGTLEQAGKVYSENKAQWDQISG